MPGRWAAPPAPAMITRQPSPVRLAAVADHVLGHAVRGDHVGLVGHVELVQGLWPRPPSPASRSLNPSRSPTEGLLSPCFLPSRWSGPPARARHPAWWRRPRRRRWLAVPDLAGRAARTCRRGGRGRPGRPARPGQWGRRREVGVADPPRMLLITDDGRGEPRGSRAAGRRQRAGGSRTGWSRRPRCFQWPVLCGRMASSLTTTSPSGRSISSTARTPTTPSSSRDAQREGLRSAPRGGRRPMPGRRGGRLVADALALQPSLAHRVGNGLAPRTPHHQGGQLAGEGNELLGHDDHLGAGGRGVRRLSFGRSERRAQGLERQRRRPRARPARQTPLPS